MWKMCRCFLLSAAAAVASAGVGYGALKLSTCGTGTDKLVYQQWTYTNSKIQIADAQLWGSFNAWDTTNGNGAALNSTLWAQPGGGMKFTLSTSGPTTVVEQGSGLCVAVLGVPGPGSGLWLQTCAAGNAAQTFQFTSSQTLLHAATGLCVDAGSHNKPCAPGSPYATAVWCNTSISIEQRVAALVSSLTVEEKQNMLDTSSGGAGGLGVDGFQWWNEALHGIANNVGVAFVNPTPYSTSFPMAITSSCSFNTTLWHAIGAAISEEGRAFANQGHAGLTFWTPTINMFRDPRWGRGQETPGEDPLVSGAYAKNYVIGMQEGNDPRYLKVSSCCKHFAAYSLELWNNTDRHHFNAVVSDSDLANYYFQPFQACVQEGRASGIMCSYNAVNGIPSCANEFLLTEVLRNTWNFNGYVTSDCGAVSDIPYNHQYTKNADQTAAATLKAGMDIGCDGYLAGGNVISQALADGAITSTDLDTAITHLFSVRMRLGEFDPNSQQPYTNIPASAACSPQNVELAQDAARQSIVLLSNPKSALPLSRSAVHTVAVVGPLADNQYINGGPNYNGVPCGGAASTLRTAFASQFTVNYAQGCTNVQCNDNSQFGAAVSAAQSSDITIVAVGIDASFENEGLDRIDINLPGQQNALVQQVCAAAKGACILVVVSGGAIDIAPVLNSVTAAFWTGLPGGKGADALVQLVFGDVSPAGLLTQTVYPQSFVNTVSLFEMGMAPGPSVWPPGSNPGRTYQYYTGKPVFPFGFGLSYTTWNVTDLSGPSSLSLAPVHQYLNENAKHGAAFAPQSSSTLASYRVNVSNTGTMNADYIALGFMEQPGAGSNGVPLQQLFAFQRVHVPAGQSVLVYLGLQARHLTHVVDDAQADASHPLALKVKRVAVSGEYTVRVGVKDDRLPAWVATKVQVQE